MKLKDALGQIGPREGSVTREAWEGALKFAVDGALFSAFVEVKDGDVEATFVLSTADIVADDWEVIPDEEEAEEGQATGVVAE